MDLCVSRSHLSKAAQHLAAYVQSDVTVLSSALPVFCHPTPFLASNSGLVAEGMAVFPILARTLPAVASDEALKFTLQCENMKVAEADKILEKWVFVNGSPHVTLADLALTEVLREQVLMMSNAEKARVPNVIRYLDHVLHLPGCPLPPMDFDLNALSGSSSAKDQTKEGKESKEAKPKKQPKGKPAEKVERPLSDATRLDFRVGTMTKVWEHPDSDKLWCEEIDLGPEIGVRQIGSGLRKHIKKEDMEGSKVVVLANLKPRKLGGFPSHGMVMCVNGPKPSEDAHPSTIEILRPPADAPNGERVTYDGIEMLPSDEALQNKPGKNPWESCAPLLYTNEHCEATMDGKLWLTSKGPVTCASVGKGSIS